MTDEREGPAPDGVQRFDPVETTVRPPDEERRLPARFQPWVGGGAVYVAWAIGGEVGRLGTFDRERGRIRLGERGYPEGGGTYRYAVDLDDAPAERLREGIGRGEVYVQSPSGRIRPAIEDAVDGRVAPAPPDAGVTGEPVAVEIEWWRERTVGVLQPWRPLNGGVVYVAWEIDHPGIEGWLGLLDRGDYGVPVGPTVRVVRLGRRSGPNWVYFLHRAGSLPGLEARVRDLRETVPERTFVTDG